MSYTNFEQDRGLFYFMVALWAPNCKIVWLVIYQNVDYFKRYQYNQTFYPKILKLVWFICQWSTYMKHVHGSGLILYLHILHISKLYGPVLLFVCFFYTRITHNPPRYAFSLFFFSVSIKSSDAALIFCTHAVLTRTIQDQTPTHQHSTINNRLITTCSVALLVVSQHT